MIDYDERITIIKSSYQGELPLWGDVLDYIGVPVESVIHILLTQNRRLAAAADEAEQRLDMVDDQCDTAEGRLDRLDGCPSDWTGA
jgi:hypothetical protein